MIGTGILGREPPLKKVYRSKAGYCCGAQVIVFGGCLVRPAVAIVQAKTTGAHSPTRHLAIQPANKRLG